MLAVWASIVNVPPTALKPLMPAASNALMCAITSLNCVWLATLKVTELPALKRPASALTPAQLIAPWPLPNSDNCTLILAPNTLIDVTLSFKSSAKETWLISLAISAKEIACTPSATLTSVPAAFLTWANVPLAKPLFASLITCETKYTGVPMAEAAAVTVEPCKAKICCIALACAVIALVIAAVSIVVAAPVTKLSTALMRLDCDTAAAALAAATKPCASALLESCAST